MQPMKLVRNPTSWGVAALAVVAILSLGAALLYISPPGQRTVIFYTDDAASIRLGDQVRIAGITVGKVKNMALESDKVQVEARVDDDAFVGDQSQIQVRMLTVVGGYYVNLVSLGAAPLGSKVIPMERVTMPYSLVRTLTDATKITDNVDATPVRDSLDQVAAGLAGTNSESLSAVIDAGNTLMSTVDRQRGQITSILNLSDEYIHNVADFSGELRSIVSKVSIIEQTLTLYSKGFGGALQGMGDVLSRVQPIGQFYENHRDAFLEKVRNWQSRARMFIERNGLIIKVLHRVQRRINRVLDTQDATPELLATDLCIPMPGSPC